jgi:phosphohistidine phosphatase
MYLLVVRHAIAEDRETFAQGEQDDSLRPITKEGRTKMRQGARGLRALVPAIDLLATSPFTRALQTARIVAQEYGDIEPQQVDALVPEAKPDALLRWFAEQTDRQTVAVVGHEPHLSGLVSWLLTGRRGRTILVIKKGAACLLELAEAPAAGKAMLLWSVTPSQLRRLAK